MPRRNRNAASAPAERNVLPLALSMGANVRRLRFVDGALTWVVMRPPEGIW